MRIDGDIRLFHHIAERHLRSSRILFQEQAFEDAVYLAGYTVECGLKALLISHTPSAKRNALIGGFFRGSTGHDLPGLRDAIKKRGVHFPPEIARNMSVMMWSTDIRYRAGRVSAPDAQVFLEEVTKLHNWIWRQLR